MTNLIRKTRFTFRFSSLPLQCLAIAIILSLIVSCKKDDAVPDIATPQDTLYNKLRTVSNFGESLPAGSEPLDEQAPIYFSFEKNGAVPVEYRKTARWDMSFSGIYRSFIGGNNGNDDKNLGHGGPGKGGVMILTKKFEEVTDIPDDNAFKTGSGLIGTDDSGAFGQGIGYYLYDFGGTIMGDGSYDKQHVAYVLSNTRTVIVRTAKGDYAKIKMLSIYKDLLDAKDWKRNSPHPYFSFQYVLAKAGSKKFEIR